MEYGSVEVPQQCSSDQGKTPRYAGIRVALQEQDEILLHKPADHSIGKGVWISERMQSREDVHINSEQCHMPSQVVG